MFDINTGIQAKNIERLLAVDRELKTLEKERIDTNACNIHQYKDLYKVYYRLVAIVESYKVKED